MIHKISSKAVFPEGIHASMPVDRCRHREPSFLFIGSASAQQGTGELRGRIVDAQNAVLPGVAVIAKNEASGQFREIVSGADGSFFMSADARQL